MTADSVDRNKGVLAGIERIGNRLPDPVFIFFWLLITGAVIIVAWAGFDLPLGPGAVVDYVPR